MRVYINTKGIMPKKQANELIDKLISVGARSVSVSPSDTNNIHITGDVSTEYKRNITRMIEKILESYAPSLAF